MLLGLSLCITTVKAQINICPNPDFELFSPCPNGTGQWNKCTGWNNVNGNLGAGNWGTPDYYNTCATPASTVKPPNMYHGNQTVQQGNGMMGLGMYNTPYPQYREYVSAKLNCSMVPGTTYTVSFWITNSAPGVNQYTIKNIGIDFSAAPHTQSLYFPISITPSYEITSNVTNTSWVQYTFMFSPTVACNYITIGNFRSDAQNNPTPTFACTGNGCAYAYYFIDNIQVLQPNTLTAAITQPSCGVVASATVSSLPGATYLWSPGNYTTASASGLAGGQYTVVATGSTSCGSYSTSVVFVVKPPVPTPTVTITAPSLVTCRGQSLTLTAGGATSYTWLPSGITTNTLSVNPASTTIYTVIGAYANGCTDTETISISPGLPIPIAVSDVTFCTNAVSCVSLTASTTISPTTFTWQPVNQTGSTITVCPTVTTVYQVYASSPNGCPSSANVVVTTETNCCSSSTVGLTPLTSLSGTVGNASYFIGNNITLTNNTTFQDAEVRIMPNVKITVPNGKILTLDHAHLYACGINMWDGIVVDNGGQVTAYNSRGDASLVEDAKVGIDVDNIGIANNVAPASPPVYLRGVIFNKNNIGVKFSNSDPTITSLPVGISECVFTCRSLTFSAVAPFNATSWPSHSAASGGLRYFATNFQSVLSAPCLMNGFALATLKQPYTGLPGHIGIKIENIGNFPGAAPAPGVDINVTYFAGFNLFDGIGIGVDIQDASFTTKMNIFQNMQYVSTMSPMTGVGINHRVNATNTMNARLDVNTYNSFWEGMMGVYGENVYEVILEDATFKSTHNFSNNPWYLGADGAYFNTNRFNYKIRRCEFHNITYNVSVNLQNGPYTVNNTSGNGTYAGNMIINENYFGPEVNSSTPITAEYSGDAITIDGINSANWSMNGSCNIFSNKINRVYRGIKVTDLRDYPVEIGGNEILLEDDMQSPQDQYGIWGKNSSGNLVINQNNVKGQTVINQRVRLIRLTDNTCTNCGPGSYSPKVTLNDVSDAYMGFAFQGNEPNTLWECNQLYTPMNYGLALEGTSTGGGVIGQQGTCSMESGNEYLNAWTPNVDYYTYCDAISDPNLSWLYVAIFMSNPPPTHFGVSSFVYGNNITFWTTFPCGGPSVNDCPNTSTYPSVPYWRTAGPGEAMAIRETGAPALKLDIFPNPTDGLLSISGYANHDRLQVRILDVTGKTVYAKTISGPGSATLDVSALNSAVYFIEIKTSDGNTLRKKLVKVQ